MALTLPYQCGEGFVYAIVSPLFLEIKEKWQEDQIPLKTFPYVVLNCRARFLGTFDFASLYFHFKPKSTNQS